MYDVSKNRVTEHLGKRFKHLSRSILIKFKHEGDKFSNTR